MLASVPSEVPAWLLLAALDIVLQSGHLNTHVPRACLAATSRGTKKAIEAAPALEVLKLQTLQSPPARFGWQVDPPLSQRLSQFVVFRPSGLVNWYQSATPKAG